jgi:hypothetical protein
LPVLGGEVNKATLLAKRLNTEMHEGAKMIMMYEYGPTDEVGKTDSPKGKNNRGHKISTSKSVPKLPAIGNVTSSASHVSSAQPLVKQQRTRRKKKNVLQEDPLTNKY